MGEIMSNALNFKQEPSVLIENILRLKGIVGQSEISEFLSDKPQKTYDPFLLKDMEKAVQRILYFISEKKKICIYGDYDSDGVNAICLLYEFLSKLTSNLSYYIPSRFDEGYGLNKAAIEKIVSEGCSLMITVDCGSVSYDEVEFAKSKGLEVIVTDHHNINGKPANCLLINPKQEDCFYPFSELCGCGVAFKLAQGIQRSLDLPKSYVNDLLDLVAIATIGDIVPLLDENRTLVKYGLSRVNEGYRKGLNYLTAACKLSTEKLRSEDIAFIIVPHINAAGRMESAETALKLLMGQTNLEIEREANLLVEYNNERKKVQEEIFAKCLEIINEFEYIPNVILVNAGDSHEGILGIVAGKLKDLYDRPAIIVCNTWEDGVVKGTGRSIEGINLYDILKESEALLIKFGGHKGACGFSMKLENLELLKTNLNVSLEKSKLENLDAEEMKVDITDLNLESIIERKIRRKI